MNGFDDALMALVSGDYDADDLLNVDPFMSGDDPMVGALALQSIKGPSPAFKQQLAQKMIAQKPQLAALRSIVADRNRQRVQSLANTKDQPSNFLGVDSVANVAAAAAAAIQVVANLPCRPIMFTADPTLSASFIINSIMVGNVNLLLNAMPLPATRFNPDSARPPLRSPILPAGTPLIVNVTNISGAAARFLATIDVVDLSPSCMAG